MTNTVVGLLRHGQTDWNIDFRLQGVTDIPLNSKGIDQAVAVGNLLQGTTWDIVLTSPLSRAFDTANIVSDLAELPKPSVTPLLLERSFGVAEGLTQEEWKQAFPHAEEIPGGESLTQLSDRSWQLLDYLAENFPGKRVLTVSHGALIRKLIGLTSNGLYPREGERLGNASLSVLVHTDEVWQVAHYYPQTYAGQPIEL